MNAKRSKKNDDSTGASGAVKDEQASDEVEAGVSDDAAVNADIAEASAEVDQLHDRLLRLQADFDNFRKRTQRERQELAVSANEDLMGELLPILDHFELGLKNALDHDANPQVLEGFQLVYDHMLTTLGRFGLEPIDAEGQPFDPHKHEAVTHMVSAEHPADVVAVQTRRGYMLKERLLRAAQVVVSSGAGDQPDGEGS